jgi:hypothetical protein
MGLPAGGPTTSGRSSAYVGVQISTRKYGPCWMLFEGRVRKVATAAIFELLEAVLSYRGVFDPT